MGRIFALAGRPPHLLRVRQVAGLDELTIAPDADAMRWNSPSEGSTFAIVNEGGDQPREMPELG